MRPFGRRDRASERGFESHPLRTAPTEIALSVFYFPKSPLKNGTVIRSETDAVGKGLHSNEDAM